MQCFRDSVPVRNLRTCARKISSKTSRVGSGVRGKSSIK